MTVKQLSQLAFPSVDSYLLPGQRFQHECLARCGTPNRHHQHPKMHCLDVLGETDRRRIDVGKRETAIRA